MLLIWHKETITHYGLFAADGLGDRFKRITTPVNAVGTQLADPVFPLFHVSSSFGFRQGRYSFAGAFSAAAVMVIVLNLFILPRRPDQAPAFSSLKEESLSVSDREFPVEFERRRDAMIRTSIPIIDRVDYSGEIRSMRSEPPTVYILEQVSDTTDKRIKY